MGEWIEIELVEEPTRQRHVALEPAEPKPPRRPPLDGRKRRRLGIGAGVAVVVGIVWVVAQSGGDLSTGAPPETLDETSDSSPELAVDTTEPATTRDSDFLALPTTTRPRASTTTRPPLVAEALGGPMLPTPSGFELVGLTTQGDLVDINLDTGEMLTTDLPGGASGAMATILASENWTFIQRWDVNVSTIVPRGEPPVDVAPPPQMASGAFRGPDPDTMWLPEYDPLSGAIEALSLIGLDGQPLDRTIDMHGWWPMQSDLAGGVIVQAGGGIYVVSEGGALRVADGELAGVGANHFLVRSCNEILSCGLFVVDRQTGERRQVPVIEVDGLAQFYGWAGTDSASVSPDGTAAVLFGLDGDSSAAALLGTDTGVYRTLSRMGGGSVSIAWSDDSRYVAFVEGSRFQVYDRSTGETIDFGDQIPLVGSFASRP